MPVVPVAVERRREYLHFAGATGTFNCLELAIGFTSRRLNKHEVLAKCLLVMAPGTNPSTCVNCFANLRLQLITDVTSTSSVSPSSALANCFFFWGGNFVAKFGGFAP
uniref:Uncharacterized protein n=1 Tax=Oryza glumipatula TaxID=40148 RepID=A0A0E0ACK0_9ORYZ